MEILHTLSRIDVGEIRYKNMQFLYLYYLCFCLDASKESVKMELPAKDLRGGVHQTHRPGGHIWSLYIATERLIWGCLSVSIVINQTPGFYNFFFLRCHI